MCFSLKIMHYSNHPAKTHGEPQHYGAPPHPNPGGGARAPPLSLTFRPPPVSYIIFKESLLIPYTLNTLA